MSSPEDPLGRTQMLPGGADLETSPTFPFKVEKEIGSGGYGQVYKAMDPALDRPVAIKVLRSQLLVGAEAETVRKRFLQEARAAATLTHPNIATVYSVGEHKGIPYLAMEYLDGEDLEAYTARRGALTTLEVADVGLQLLDALGAAHRAGIVHRDIKPSNLMLLPTGVLKVMDFGIARLAGRELVQTQAGSLIATPQFASPEQLGGEEVDLRSDLYSVAVVCYNLLSGRYPYLANSLAELFRKSMYEDPLPLSQHGVYSSPDWERFLIKALAKSRDQRYQDASSMARDMLALEPDIASRGATPLPRRAVSGSLDSATLDSPGIDSPGIDSPGIDSPGVDSPGMSASGMTSPSREPQTLDLPTPMDTDLVPAGIFRAPESASAEGLIQSFVRSFVPKSLGAQDPRTVLPRLLEVPLHTEAYRGALTLGDDIMLFLGEGQILGSVVRGSESGEDLFQLSALEHTLWTPGDGQSALIEPLASFLRAATAGDEPEQKALQASFVDLPRLLAGLRADSSPRVVQLVGSGRLALLVVQDGGHHLLLGGNWPETEGDVNWAAWLRASDADISIWRPQTKPDEAWYRVAFANTTLKVEGVGAFSPALSTTPSPQDTSQVADIAASVKISPSTESQAGVVVQAMSSPAAAALSWMVRELPQAFSGSGRSKEWKYLAGWLPLIERATLYGQVEPDSGSFDVVTLDAAGKALHLLVLAKTVDGALIERVTARVAAIKQRHEKRGDVGAVLILGREVTDDAVATYRSLLHRGRGNSWFGMDQSLGYQGFVRLSARRGYHLLLGRHSGEIETCEPLWDVGGGESA